VLTARLPSAASDLVSATTRAGLLDALPLSLGMVWSWEPRDCYLYGHAVDLGQRSWISSHDV
jgi:hypothetical protein